MSEIPRVWVNDIVYRVRDICKPETAFFHFEAYLDQHNWNERITSAIKKGAKILVLDASDPYYDYREIEKEYSKKIVTVAILNLHKKVSYIAAKFFDNPQKKLQIVTVTGTNGKTSVAHVSAQALNNIGFKSAVISSIGYGVISKPLITEPLTGFRIGYTTPPAINLFKILNDFVSQKVEIVILEVTSHALVWHTTAAISSKVAVFTNISDDHLEYHGNILNYINAKKELFNPSSSNIADSYVINFDDIVGRTIIRELLALGKSTITYGFLKDINNKEHVFIKEVVHKLSGMDILLKYKDHEQSIATPFLGSFYLYNILAVFGILIALKIPFHKTKKAFSYIVKVPGRMVTFYKKNLPLTIVDFAHNPDGIEKCLRSIKENISHKKICVICGTSDITTDISNKKTAKIISRFANKIIITTLSSAYVSDNSSIIKKFKMLFTEHKNIITLDNRKHAIKYAIKNANRDDVVVILGKGDQNYILKAGKMISHNDIKCVNSIYSSEFFKHASLMKLLSRKFYEYNEKIAIYHNQDTITFKDLDRLSSSYANRLKNLNVSNGDNVGICLNRSIDTIAILIACIKIGAVYVPLDYKNYELHSIKLIQKVYKPKIIIYDGDFDLKDFKNSYSLEFFLTSNFTDFFKYEYKVSEDSPLCILYTSGSTDNPKGVVRTQKMVLHQLDYFIKNNNQDLVLGQVFSLRHIASIIQIFGSFCVGGSIVIIDDNVKKIPEKLTTICNIYGITRLGFSPERYKYFLNEIDEKKLKLNSVKEISCTGDYLTYNIIEKSIHFFPNIRLIDSYGSTETGGVARRVCTMDTDNQLTLYPGVKIKILDENNNYLSKNQIGEITVSSPSVAYYHNKDNKNFVTIKNKIYFKTGDLGYLNDNNNLIVLGRNKFTIKVKGRKIFFTDINKKFKTCSMIKESVISEIKIRDINILVLFYVSLSTISLETKLRKIAKKLLPIECRPKIYVVVDKIPYLENDKVDYKTLEKDYLNNIK